MELVHNTTNEIMLVGAIYANPDLLVEYSQYIKSKYDFYDDVTKFFYDNAVIMYETRTQEFTKTSVLTYMAEDESRMQTYREYKGWNTVAGYMQLANVDDFKGYFSVLKKYSLLREYQRNGFNIQKIIEHRQFEQMTAQDIYKLIRAKADKINTVILTNEEAEILNSGLTDMVFDCLKTPDVGLQIPFPLMNEMFRGFKLGTMMCSGMLSNAGKSRFMFKLIAWIALVKKQRVLVLLNEMEQKEVMQCLLTTVINNPEFQELHGIHIQKNEKEITLGLYRDGKGNIIRKHADETEGEYINRVMEESDECSKIIDICNWVNEETQGLIFCKNISDNYSDQNLEFEIRKACITKGIKYVMYDTLKNDIGSVGEWSCFKTTVTKLSELAKNLGIFIYGSIQLTDSANDYKPDELNSNNIAEAKSIKHVLHTLVLYKEIPQHMKEKYKVLRNTEDFGEQIPTALNPYKRYYIGNVDKNRFGSKNKLVFEVDLDKNIWTEIGILAK